MGFNLSTLATKDTATLHLKHPVTFQDLYGDDEKTQPCLVKMYGKDSQVYRNAIFSLQNKRAARGKTKVSPEQVESEWIDVLVACTISIENLDIEPGKPCDSPEMYKELYSTPEFSWVQEQVNEWRGEVANFLDN